MTPDWIASDGNAMALVIDRDMVLMVVIFIAGVVFGLSAKHGFDHCTAGLWIKVMKPFQPDDVISVSGITGSVETIRWCITVLKTSDNTRMILPNRLLMDDLIITHPKTERSRIEIRFGITPDDDVDAALDIIDEALSKRQDILPEPMPKVALEEACTCAVAVKAQFWTLACNQDSARSDTIASVEALFAMEGVRGRVLNGEKGRRCGHHPDGRSNGAHGADLMSGQITRLADSL